MEPNTKHGNNNVTKICLIVFVLALLAGLIGWKIGSSDKQPANNQQSNNTPVPSTPNSNNTSQASVLSLVSYTLPDGWTESTCPSSSGASYIIPAGASLDCSANPSSPIKVSIDPGNSKDCNQLQNVQNVKKHICSSLFINDRKTLKALTEYNQESSFKKDTSLSVYYIDTGKGVVKVEYIYTSSNEYEAGFDQLAKSIQVKN